jgi:SAM-dependent methyltransferase
METLPYYSFVLEKLAACFKGDKSVRVLDYGCGDGRLVKFLMDNGYDAYGVDVDTFFDDFYSHTDQNLLTQKRIAVIDNDGSGDFSGRTFDFIISHMVIEHIEDKIRHFKAMSRYMNGESIALLLYPVSESIREGHVRQFFIHWIPKGPLRYAASYVQKALRIPQDSMGHANIRDYVREKIGIVDASCFYETSHTIDCYLRGFFVFSHIENDYFIFRAKQKRLLWLAAVLRLIDKTGVCSLVFRLYTGAVVTASLKPRP